jgi:hypothetical protein
MQPAPAAMQAAKTASVRDPLNAPSANPLSFSAQMGWGSVWLVPPAAYRAFYHPTAVFDVCHLRPSTPTSNVSKHAQATAWQYTTPVWVTQSADRVIRVAVVVN